MSEAKPIPIPLDQQHKLDKTMSPTTEDDINKMKNIPYQNAIGTLMYLAIATRPDIAHAVSYLSQFNNNPGQPHWNAVKRLMRYLKGTMSTCLVYEQETEPKIIGYADANWGNDTDDRRSYTGFIYFLAKGAISWTSKKQPTVTLSTTEAEHIAVTAASKEAIWLRDFLTEINILKGNFSIPIMCDNKSVINLSQNPTQHERSKHFAIKQHFLRENVEKGSLDIIYTPTELQVADMLTKGLPKSKLTYCCKHSGLIEK